MITSVLYGVTWIYKYQGKCLLLCTVESYPATHLTQIMTFSIFAVKITEIIMIPQTINTGLLKTRTLPTELKIFT